MNQLTPLQYALYMLLEAHSEAYYCAGWAFNLEYVVWHDVLQQRATGSDRPDLLAFAALSEVVGGWITYGDDGPQFVPIAEWVDIYSKSLTGICD